MPTDPAIRDHQTWLGYLQPDGLVVSPAALVDSQVSISRNVAPLQKKFELYVDAGTEKAPKQPEITDLVQMLTGFLEWPENLLCGTDTKPIPEVLKTPLREFGETLEPDLAFQDSHPVNSERPWMILLQDFPAGTDLDAPIESAQAGWSASHARRFERLLRETGVPIGILSNRTNLRLVYAPRGENTGSLTFPVGPMTEVAGRPILSAFNELLRSYTLLSAPSGSRLPDLLKKSRQYQARVSTALAHQVLDALYELLRGFQSANEYAHGELLGQILAEHPDQVYWGNLTVLMRLVFLLYAEDRGLMPGSGLYVCNYAVHGLFEKLRNDAEHFPDTMDHRYGAWAQLLALFRVVFHGCDHPHLKMPAREGHLFDPERYPFLEGRTSSKARMPLISDGVVFRILHKLLILDGERLSYRTLDVEQIGSVYETMMGFRLELASGQTIALKPAKAYGAPVPINLEKLLATEAGDRANYIEEQTDYKISEAMNRDIKVADNIDSLLATLERRIARSATPHPVASGTMVLMPTDERRKTGSHYTPRSLTEPIVAKALEPILSQLGDHPVPEDILNLKVCDPAMGSGAFLVEACRQLADHLVAAWSFHGYKPAIPPDEDEILYARRLIAQRCLYGVDRNPMAVELAKLSLWLATLARDHPFTFLDHSLRAGDSLVGLSRDQIAHFNLTGVGQPTFVQGKLAEQMTIALRARRQILAAGDDLPPDAKAQKLVNAEEALDPARLAGDLFIASFFDNSKARERDDNRDLYLGLLVAWKQNADTDALAKIQSILTNLRTGQHPIAPFHWEIEFPEVFAGNNAGFDVIVGNPPFAGKNTLINSNRDGFLDWLKTIHKESHGNADLVAHFFRRAFDLLRKDGSFGLIATNTIRQGDTRSTSLRWICTHGGTIYAARRRYKWPGQAAVIVSVVHISKGELLQHYTLDGRDVPIITGYLFHAGGNENPSILFANQGKSFQGSILLGMGFTFDDTDTKGVASSIANMHRLIEKNPRNAERIFPYIGGEEVNNNPMHEYHRFAIDFFDRSLEEAEQWPDLLAIVRERVKPERDYQKRDALRERWWQYAEKRPGLYRGIEHLDRVMVINCGATPHMAFTSLPARMIFANTLVVITTFGSCVFGVLQSRIHEVWARFFASSMKDDLRYTPTDCFETFPFPEKYEDDKSLKSKGDAYYKFRADLMVRKNEGLTATYNRFNDATEQNADILTLRELHNAMDRAVLDVYGWEDIETACGFGLDFLEIEEDDFPANLKIPELLWWPTAEDALAFSAQLPQTRRRLPWRYCWPEETRDEVLARLLELNKKRADEERRSGLAATASEQKTKKAKRRTKKKDRGPTFIDLGE